MVVFLDTQTVTGAATPNTEAIEWVSGQILVLTQSGLFTIKFPTGAGLARDDLVADIRGVGGKLEREEDQQ